MSDSKTKSRVGFRTEVKANIDSGHVQVLIYHYQPEGGAGWFPTLSEARRDAADRMSHLAHELLRQADCLRQDERGR